LFSRILLRLGAAVAGLTLAAGLATPAMASSSAPAALAQQGPPTCVVTAAPSKFIETGEGSQASSVVFIITVECQPVYSEQTVEIRSPQLNNACQKHLLWYSVATPEAATTPIPAGDTFDVTLDNDGNATAVVWGGPSCAASTALIEADLTVAPFTTATTAVVIAPPVTTKPGVFAFPGAEVEDATTSSVAVIFYAEFPDPYAERHVQFSDAQLYDQCGGRIAWFGSNGQPLGFFTKSVTTTLDNNGNAFVVALAGPSCATGTSLIEADLVGPPYITLTNSFTVLSPRPTV
jgi:hypothetical protein